MELMKRIIGLANQIIEAVDLGNIEEPQAPQTELTDEDVSALFFMLSAAHENVQPPTREEVRLAMEAVLSRRTAQPAEPPCKCDNPSCRNHNLGPGVAAERAVPGKKLSRYIAEPKS
jgi:hypothetical protein